MYLMYNMKFYKTEAIILRMFLCFRRRNQLFMWRWKSFQFFFVHILARFLVPCAKCMPTGFYLKNKLRRLWKPTTIIPHSPTIQCMKVILMWSGFHVYVFSTCATLFTTTSGYQYFNSIYYVQQTEWGWRKKNQRKFSNEKKN